MGWIHNVKVDIFTVPSRRSIGDAIARVRPNAGAVLRLSIGEQRDITGGKIIAVILVVLVAARILGEDEIVARRGMIGDSLCRVVLEESELCTSPAGEFHLVNLWIAG